ncbi:threonylcarbamoyl-AMP synthase [Alicyclobacillus cellulosilyticus]|uniref:Threonylcarbamoyl-AMP synthase n=1 Tax=Alicyclobacillus cellulosilyticus TaxID=1003997 RepID=A0A917NHW8_9BACL|nr:L-threonylcarbamoyladenylate synthase [Alicyclobacillus cellulosilyticus]GGJ02416.1 threonylcarbamoyl-AMP synthase [Alicyclobacillus cellulosilyticus]
MNVWRVHVDADGNMDEAAQAAIADAAACLRAGGVIAFPTETVYGLGANAWDDAAARKVFQAKGRPADNPLIVHIADMDMLGMVTCPDALPEPARRAMAALWPGPLTVIVPAGPRIAATVRAGLPTVGVRLPDHPVARALIRAAGCPVAAPSANRSGRPSPTDAAAVLADLAGRIDGVVDGGPCQVGVESTVVAFTAERGVIYRPGGVTREALMAASGVPVDWHGHLLRPDAGLAAAMMQSDIEGEPPGVPRAERHAASGAPDLGPPPSPGMKYRHYAPDADVHVFVGPNGRVLAAMRAWLATLRARHPEDTVAVIAERTEGLAQAGVLAWSPPPGTPYTEALAREIYRLLRAFEAQGARHILVQGVAPDGLGAAVMNRLAKAASGRVHLV